MKNMTNMHRFHRKRDGEGKRLTFMSCIGTESQNDCLQLAEELPLKMQFTAGKTATSPVGG